MYTSMQVIGPNPKIHTNKILGLGHISTNIIKENTPFVIYILYLFIQIRIGVTILDFGNFCIIYRRAKSDICRGLVSFSLYCKIIVKIIKIKNLSFLFYVDKQIEKRTLILLRYAYFTMMILANVYLHIFNIYH